MQSLVDEDGLYLMRLAEDHFSGNEVVAAIPAVSTVVICHRLEDDIKLPEVAFL